MHVCALWKQVREVGGSSTQHQQFLLPLLRPHNYAENRDSKGNSPSRPGQRHTRSLAALCLLACAVVVLPCGCWRGATSSWQQIKHTHTQTDRTRQQLCSCQGGLLRHREYPRHVRPTAVQGQQGYHRSMGPHNARLPLSVALSWDVRAGCCCGGSSLPGTTFAMKKEGEKQERGDAAAATRTVCGTAHNVCV